MNYATIKTADIANGVGVRVSLFVSGCTHHCKGCFNQETWDFNYGKLFTSEVIDSIMDALNHDWIDGLSVLGGEPLHPKNHHAVLVLIHMVRRRFPKKSIWVYTGYTFEEIKDSPILQYIDVLVDGKFIEEKKNITLQFRGSENQRVIDVQKSFAAGSVVIRPDDERRIIC